MSLRHLSRGVEMFEDVSDLKEAYDFYKAAKKDENAIACGCLSDAEDWVWKELDALFADDEEG